jgi:hypothetical protein
MAFLPVELPIEEILLTNFITDIATISNANDLILKDKLEDLLNNFEIDVNTLSLGTDNPINYVRAQSFIIQDTGLIFQTGTPLQIISRLEKNTNGQSVFTVDLVSVNEEVTSDSVNTNSIVINDSAQVDGPATFNSTFQTTSSVVESKESVTVDLIKNGNIAEARLTLTSASRKNIFVTLKATSAPNLNPVYDGTSLTAPIDTVALYLDFDASNPPLQNTTFTIYLVDVVEEILLSTIIPAIISGLIPIVIRGGDNLSVTPNVQIALHNSPSSYEIGVNPNSINIQGSDVLQSNVPSVYGHNLSLLYILDQNGTDRLLVNGMVGMEFFVP